MASPVKTLSLAILLLASTSSISAAAVITTNSPNLIVLLRDGADVDAVIRDSNVKPCFVYRHALHGFAAPMDAATITKLKADARVRRVEVDGKVVLCGQTIPTGVIRMGLTNFPEAHLNGQDNRISVDVAVLDTGIQINHPDLNVVQAVDCCNSGLNGDDWEGHGTHVAGIIGALDNDIGVVGVAPGVRLWSVQVIPPGTVGGTWSDFIAGCDYIAEHADQIQVVNCSLGNDGSPTPYDAIHTAVTNLVNQGIVFVAAAGNNFSDIAGADSLFGTEDDIVPAAFPEVMAVTVMEPVSDGVPFYANASYEFHVPAFVISPGAGIDVIAPGVNILSTYTNSGYALSSGTSMACGYASGLVALYIAANGRAHTAQGVYDIRQTIVNNSQSQREWPTWPLTGYPNRNYAPLTVSSENWIPQPNILTVSTTVPGAQLSFQTVPGYTYAVQYSSSLAVSNQWADLTATNGLGSLTTVTVSDPSADATRFYRLVRKPSP